MEKDTLQQIKSVSPKLGTLLGIMWIMSFIGFANSATTPLYSMFGLGIGIGSLFAAVIFCYQFRWRVCKGDLSFGGQWFFVMSMFFYACILMAMGVFLYMRYMDGGKFAQMYTELSEVPEQRVAMESMLAGTGVTVDDLVSAVSNIKPIHFALQITESNLLASFMISPIVTLFARIKTNKPIEKIKN